MKQYHADPMNQDIPASLVIQYIPHGDSNSQLLRGQFTTRNIKTGDPQLSGHFCRCEFLTPSDKDKEINELDTALLDELDEIAGTLEGFHLDVRQVDFLVEKGKLYVTKESQVERKSMATKLRILSELQSENQITAEEYVGSITPNEMNSLLYSTINAKSVEGQTVLQGGIAGSLGATSGKVYFSTKKLMEAYWKAKSEDEDTNLILLKKSTYAEDVQAVEIGCGVISSEGGYTSHAPIVARSLGKPAIVFPGITYHDGYVDIGGHKVNEGDYVSMEIVSTEDPCIYLGRAELEYPDIEKNGVKDLLEKAKKFAMGIKILANADTPDESRQAKLLGADGIGLCRTEHMFHRNKRIYVFRDLLITKNAERKKEILSKVKKFLSEDFQELFEVMDGRPITIRLLDAPLHEFLPTGEVELEETMKQLPELASEQSKDEIRQSFLRLKETNPMLGHRGCRVGISSPEIYDVMTAAILEAALKVKTEKNIDVQPGIMIPLIMSKEEMYLIKNGQIMEGKESVKGIIGVIREFMKSSGLQRQPFDVKIGAMIELPAAALSAADIAKQAEFFSFGTNDLTQTTMGLSRDDINSFLPAYTEMDVWKSDPFQNLLEPVKQLIDQAIQTGRQIRPDLSVGICGEHGANPEVIKYCLDIGMNYISCSPFGIPIAILAVAQSNLQRSNDA
jgi:pyruvate,orthophosphate dikinase